MERSTTSAAGRIRRAWQRERHHPLVRDPRRRRRQPRPAHQCGRPRHRFRHALADRLLATLPYHRLSPQPGVGDARLPGASHRDGRRRSLHGARMAGCRHSVFLVISPALAGPRRGRDLFAARDRRDQPAAPAVRSARLADGSLARLRAVAGRPDSQHRNRNGSAIRLDAGDRGGRRRQCRRRSRLAREPRRAHDLATGPGRPTAGPERERTPLGPDAESLARHRQRLGPLPTVPSGQLIAELEASGLLGRGGAGFPVGRKWRAVAERSSGGAVVLANGAEGEPLSLKDRSLMAARPHLVIDGALLAARAVGANDIIFYVGVEHRAAEAALRHALAERPADVRGRARIVKAPAGYVSGEESAAVHYVNAGDARPTTTPPRPFERGVGGRPTLVQNVESLALAALIAYRGHAWYQGLGHGRARGIGLLTVSGAVNHAGVHEIELGATLWDAAASAGGLRGDARAVLLGGYFGGWADVQEQWGLPLDAPSMSARGLALGCGVVHFLPSDTCGVEATARLMTYLASQSARQCGPCVFGLSATAGATQRLAAQSPQPGDLDRLVRWSGQLTGRGACHHPDGAATLLQSALAVFADDFAGHQRRRCLTTLQPQRVAVA